MHAHLSTKRYRLVFECRTCEARVQVRVEADLVRGVELAIEAFREEIPERGTCHINQGRSSLAFGSRADIMESWTS